MSAQIARNKPAKARKPAALCTVSGTRAFPALIIGFFITIGALSMFMAVLSPASASGAFAALQNMAWGLGGCLNLLLPPLLVWLGAALMLSAIRRVDVRTPCLALCLYALVLAAILLITRVSGAQETLMMEEIIAQTGARDYASVLRGAYRFCAKLGGESGGMIGMALAWPLYTLGAWPAVAVCAVLILVLLPMLLHFDVLGMARRASDARAARQGEREQAKMNQPQPPASSPYAPPEPPAYAPPEPLTYAPPEPREQAQMRAPVSSSGLTEDEDSLQPLWKGAPPSRQPSSPPPAEPDVFAPVHLDGDDQPPWVEPPKAQSGTPPAPSGGVHDVHIEPAVQLGRRVNVPKNAAPSDGGSGQPDGTPNPKKSPEPMRSKQLAMRLAEPYAPPPFDLLSMPRRIDEERARREDQEQAEQLMKTLQSFEVDAALAQITHGPAVTRFAIKLGNGVKVNKLTGIHKNIAIDMSVDNVRIETPIPGTSYVGIEVLNKTREIVTLREVLQSAEMLGDPCPTTIALGRDIGGKPVLCDLTKTPHLLIAGATGMGKSVCINSLITSLLYRASPQQVRLILVDPKMVEFQHYKDVPHLLAPVICVPKQASAALSWAVTEMLDRYGRFTENGTRNIDEYNATLGAGEAPMPRIIIVIDELADLMSECKKEVEQSIRRLSQLARASGVHLVVATQRPSVDIITGVIKANIPSRIAFATSSLVDSRTILDSSGAERLLGQGDMLYMPMGTLAQTRIQGCFVSGGEVQHIVADLRNKYPTDYDQGFIAQLRDSDENAEGARDRSDETGSNVDELFMDALDMAVQGGQISISQLQRSLGVGHSRAGRIVDQMARRGYVTNEGGSKPRKTLMTAEEYQTLLRNDGV